MVPKCPIYRLSGLRRERDAAFAASREYVTVQVLKELKCANLLNHVAPSIKLMMQM